MTQTDNSALDGLSVFPAARLAWIVLILATLYICYFHNLGAIGLVGPDEPRYAWIARDMVESGDWVTPRLYGKPWFEKPVLYYWGAALSFKLFGVSEAAARLPSAVAALLATLAMAWLAWRLYGPETARWLLLLLPTTVGMIGFSHAAATDMPFAGMLTIAMVCAARLLGLVPTFSSSSSFTSSTSFTSFFFGFFLGLAVLAKGPAAIVLSGGAVLLWAIFTKRWRDAFRCLHPVAIASFCLTALPWYILCARRNPDFFRVFIIEHNFKRYLTPEFQHIQPFWYYIPILLIAFIPWTFILLWSAAQGLANLWRKRYASPTAIFLLSWAAFCLFFFSTSKSKLPGYILPAVPAIGLLMARSCVAFSTRVQRSFRQQLFGWSTLTFAASLVLLWMGRQPSSSPTKRAMLVAGCVLLLFTLANLLLALNAKSQKQSFDPATLCVLPVFLILLMFHIFSSPWLGWDPSGKTLASEIRAMHIPPDQIYVASMRRGQLYSLSFYLHREIQTWDPDEPQPGYLLVSRRGCKFLVKPPWVCMNDTVELGSSGWFVYRVERNNSVSRFGGLGGSGGDRSGAGRQPR